MEKESYHIYMFELDNRRMWNLRRNEWIPLKETFTKIYLRRNKEMNTPTWSIIREIDTHSWATIGKTTSLRSWVLENSTVAFPMQSNHPR